MEHSFVQGRAVLAKDVFEIKPQYNTGHEPGLVVVLDQVVVANPTSLVGKVALIRTPGGVSVEARIEDARDHGPANSLFFRNLKRSDVPIGSEVVIIEGIG